jgi:hypothetical protein
MRPDQHGDGGGGAQRTKVSATNPAPQSPDMATVAGVEGRRGAAGCRDNAQPTTGTTSNVARAQERKRV